MDTTKLSKTLREKAEEMRREAEAENISCHDSELILCLARMVEGKDVYDAFGAPGNWGYGTPIGDALMEAYNS